MKLFTVVFSERFYIFSLFYLSHPPAPNCPRDPLGCPDSSTALSLTLWGIETTGDLSRMPWLLRCIISVSHMPLVSPFPEVARDHAGRDWEQQAREMWSLSLSLSLSGSVTSPHSPPLQFSLLISGDNLLQAGVPDPPTHPPHTQRFVFIPLPNH